MTARRGWGLSEQHLALDALVAFVDGELSPNAYDRAASHLASCPSCAAEAAGQRQARAAVRAAATPSMSPQLLQALQSIPTNAPLPGQPDGLALTDDGQLVAVARPDRAGFGQGRALGDGTPLGGSQQPLGSSSPLGTESSPVGGATLVPGSNGRRARHGAGVVFSGLVLGALALVNVPQEERPITDVPRPAGVPYRSALTPHAAVPASTSGGSQITPPVPAGPVAPPPPSTVPSFAPPPR